MSKIIDLDINNRPREKALRNGISTLTDSELLAIIIRCGNREKSALELAKNIIDKYQSLTNLLNADLHSLMEIKGIKKAKAVEIASLLEIAKRISHDKREKRKIIKEADEVYDLFKLELENELQEKFIVIFLNVRLAIIKVETLFVGGECNSIVDINLIFKKAIMCGARKIICLHNHPSGDSSPSKDDYSLTSKISIVGKIVGVELLDHLIIGKNNYFSFSKNKI